MPQRSEPSTLTAAFFESRGVTLTRSLKDWLARACYISNSRSNDADRIRYEHWVVGVVESSFRSSGGVTSVDWSRVSPIIPKDAVVVAPLTSPQIVKRTMISPAHPACQPTSLQRNVPVQPLVNAKTQLQVSCLQVCPLDLRVYMQQALDLLELEVNAGRRSYSTVSVSNVLEVSHRLRVQRTQLALKQDPPTLTAQKYVPPPPQDTQERKRRRSSPSSSSASSSGSSTFVKRDIIVKRKSCRSDQTSAREARFSRDSEVAPKGVHHHRPCLTTEATTTTEDFFLNLLTTRLGDKKKSASFVGLSTAMERKYSRDEPTPADIRPPHVLSDAFSYVTTKSQRKSEFADQEEALKYLSDQLKGMRQDLRIQDVRTPFTVMVYESDARTTLDLANLSDFNQCQAALKQFYLQGYKSNLHCNLAEFTALRMLYITLLEQNDTLATEIALFMTSHDDESYFPEGTRVLFKDLMCRPAVLSTVASCISLQLGDSVSAIRLLSTSRHEFPSIHTLLKILLQRLRVKWLQEISGSFRGDLPMSFLVNMLGFFPLVEHNPLMQKREKSVLVELVGPSSLDSVLETWPSTIWFADGSLSAAEASMKALFEAIKLEVPREFSLRNEVFDFFCVMRHSLKPKAKKSGKNDWRASPQCNVDAQVVAKSIREYVAFLTTRADACR